MAQRYYVVATAPDGSGGRHIVAKTRLTSAQVPVDFSLWAGAAESDQKREDRQHHRRWLKARGLLGVCRCSPDGREDACGFRCGREPVPCAFGCPCHGH